MPPRPHSISELAQFAKDATQPVQKSVKDWLRLADALRKQGQQASTEGDIQAGFVFLARSATYILEKIPKHPNYEELNETQMSNLKSVSDEPIVLGICKTDFYCRRMATRYYTISSSSNPGWRTDTNSG